MHQVAGGVVTLNVATRHSIANINLDDNASSQALPNGRLARDIFSAPVSNPLACVDHGAFDQVEKSHGGCREQDHTDYDSNGPGLAGKF